jgi:protein-tyrosine-phosphatase
MTVLLGAAIGDGSAMQKRGKVTMINKDSSNITSNIFTQKDNDKYEGWDEDKLFNYDDTSKLDVNDEKAQVEQACKGSVKFFDDLDSRRNNLVQNDKGICAKFEDYDNQINELAEAINAIKKKDYQNDMRTKVNDIYALNKQSNALAVQVIKNNTTIANQFATEIHQYSDLLFTIDKQTNKKALKNGQLYTVIMKIKEYIQKETNDIAVQRKQLEYREAALTTLKGAFENIKDTHDSKTIKEEYSGFTQHRDMFFNTIKQADKLRNDYNTLLNEAAAFQKSLNEGDEKLTENLQNLYSNVTNYDNDNTFEFEQDKVNAALQNSENKKQSTSAKPTSKNKYSDLKNTINEEQNEGKNAEGNIIEISNNTNNGDVDTESF